MTDRDHPIETPHPRQTPERASDAVERVDGVWLILGLGKPAAPAAGMRERADEQRRRGAPPPRCRRVREIHPVPLRLLASRVVDDRDRTPLGRVATLTMRTQRTHPQLPGERRIRLIKPEPDDLVEQRHRPQMRILDQPLAAVVD